MPPSAASSSSVAVIGLGYVGLPLLLELAEQGTPTIGFDIDDEVASSINAGRSHVDDIADDRIARARQLGMRATSDHSELAGAGTFIICVPTPLGDSGQPDTSYIASAVRLIAPYVTRRTLVVLESTSYPGTTEELVAAPLAATTGLEAGVDFCVAFSPERIDPGNARFTLANTPKIVSGLRDCCRERAASLYRSVAGEVVQASGLREAELAKLLENTYRQVNIALMNEMAVFCRALDIDIYEAIRCAATKPFGYQAFYPGPGVGGHCIPIDPKFLAARVQSELGYAFRFVELAQEINEGMPRYVVDRLGSLLSASGASLNGSRVLLLGVTYKRDVGDMRQAPSEDIVRELRSRGAAVTYLDPHVARWEVDGTPVAHHAHGAPADAALLIQDHTAFDSIDVAALAPICLDTRGRLSGPTVHRL